MTKLIFWTYGRFQPPTIGHQILIKALHDETTKRSNKGSIAIVFVSSKSNAPGEKHALTDKVKSSHQKAYLETGDISFVETATKKYPLSIRDKLIFLNKMYPKKITLIWYL